MGKDRLKRLLILLLIIGLLAGGFKVLADWQAKRKVLGQESVLSVDKIGEKISDFSQNVLGKTIEVLPGSKELKEKIISTTSNSSDNQTINNQNTTQTEKVEIKTQEIVEIIKDLPATELERIKKQIFKDFCQSILQEATNGGN
jgi:hypothetical protein